jgi:hypothetical protein
MIATYDTGRTVGHLSLHPNESCVSVVGHDASLSSCRIYEAGWTRTDDWDSDDDLAHDTDSMSDAASDEDTGGLASAFDEDDEDDFEGQYSDGEEAFLDADALGELGEDDLGSGEDAG